jgi:hypothetical protein
MSQILLEPGNPLDLRDEKLAPLITALRDLDSSYEVRLGYNDQRGYGVTWWEVLHIWIPWTAIGGAAAKKIVELAIDWAHHRMKGDEPNNRPRSVSIYGPDGQILKQVRVDSSGQEEPSEHRRTKPPIRE